MTSPRRPETFTGSSASSGFTLIEVLVAMLIIAIGVLGIAALQFKGLQYNQDAYFRTQVNFLAYDIADRMRLNKANAAAYASNLTSYNVPGTRPTGCTQTGTGAVGVTNDLACWKQQIYDAMPPGSLADINNDGAGQYTIKLSWTDREGNTHDVTYTFEL
jgi:type IV pilus assembly protein PilV